MKYYIEVTQDTAYSDSTTENFFADTPLDTVEAAKAFVADTPNEGATIYCCEENILTPVWEWTGLTWRPVEPKGD